MVSGIINVLVGVITLGIQPWLITLTSPLVIADITKISSTNCLQIENMIVTRICLWHSPVKIVNLGSLIRIMAWSADHCTHIHRVPIEHTIILHRHKLSEVYVVWLSFPRFNLALNQVWIRISFVSWPWLFTGDKGHSGLTWEWILCTTYPR